MKSPWRSKNWNLWRSIWHWNVQIDHQRNIFLAFMETSLAFIWTLDGQNLTFKPPLDASRSRLCSARRISAVPHVKMIFIAFFWKSSHNGNFNAKLITGDSTFLAYMATSLAFIWTLDGQNLTLKPPVDAPGSKVCSARRISAVPHTKMILFEFFWKSDQSWEFVGTHWITMAQMCDYQSSKKLVRHM